MRVLSVNCGRAEPIAGAKASGRTGIYKRPVATPVTVTTHGLTEDVICDTENHGGVDQAIYMYGAPDYAWWGSALSHDLEPGTFGENITITDLESADLVIGDRLHIGALTLEVTAPRIPCVTLARRMDDPAFLKRFRDAERPGVYCRVIQEGTIQIGDEVQYEPHTGVRVSVLELFRDFFAPHDDEATIRRHLGTPLALRARRDKEAQLERLLAQQVQPH
ncbi:MAG: MOSC domain-containing protein [Roseiflexaceae bacterium]